jgi:hypothetical protein
MTASGHEMPMGGTQPHRTIIFKQETTIGKGRTFGQRRKMMESERVPLFIKTTIEQGKRKDETSLR